MIAKIKAFGNKYIVPVVGGVAFAAPVAASADTLENVISNATSSIATTMGFSLESGVEWMRDNLLLPFIGSGLGVLYELRWYIVALVALSIIVYFAFRAFGFFRN